MNQTMTKLYSTPSKQTDFEKIKTAAKVAEKTVGKYFHPLMLLSLSISLTAIGNLFSFEFIDFD